MQAGCQLPEKPREVLFSCTFKLVRRAGRPALIAVEPMREATLGASMRVVEAIVTWWRICRGSSRMGNVLSVGVDRQRTRQAGRKQRDSEGRENFLRCYEVRRLSPVKSGSLEIPAPMADI